MPEMTVAVPSPKAPSGVTASDSTRRRFIRNSIGFKLFGVVVVLLLLMAAAAGISMQQAQNVDALLDSTIDGYVPAYTSLARANVRSLEQALLLRRIVIARQAGGAASVSAADKDAVLAK